MIRAQRRGAGHQPPNGGGAPPDEAAVAQLKHAVFRRRQPPGARRDLRQVGRESVGHEVGRVAERGVLRPGAGEDRAGGAGGQIFNIGKSRASLYDKENKVNVTFNDVAGLDEAKEEVQREIDEAGRNLRDEDPDGPDKS